MTNYQVIIGYRAVILIDVKAENEKEAKEKAVKMLEERKDKIYTRNIQLADDNFKANGVVDMDATWNMYDK